MEELLCKRCGKNMTYEDGSSIVAWSISVVDAQSSPNPKYTEFLQQQVGEFTLGETYNFCFECLIKTLMGKKV